MRVLAIHAHPDDVEFQCAGTLVLLREAGCEVTIATMTPGDCGSAEHDCEAIAEIRRGEARAAAALIGAEYVCLEFRDLAIFNDDDSRRRVTEALRRTRPDLILTAPPVDYLCDHEMTSLLVRDACFARVVPELRHPPVGPGSAARRRSRTSISSIRSKATTATAGRCRWISTSTSRASSTIKRQMLACHASQRDWLLRQHGMDEYLESQAEWGAHRGSGDRRREGGGVPPVQGAPLPAGQPAPDPDRPGWPGAAAGSRAGLEARSGHRVIDDLGDHASQVAAVHDAVDEAVLAAGIRWSGTPGEAGRGRSAR